MSEQLRQLAVTAFDKIAGPVLDRVGSKTDGQTLVDRRTGEVVGTTMTAVGDGVAYFEFFDKPTKLRKDAKTKVAKKLGVK